MSGILQGRKVPDLIVFLERACDGAYLNRKLLGDGLVLWSWKTGTSRGTSAGWEFVIVRGANEILAQVWTAGGVRDRDSEVATAVARIMGANVAMRGAA